MTRIALIAALLIAAPAWADTFTYGVDIVRPINVPGFTGPSPDFVRGTIATDCNNCVMVKSDIVDWNLTIATHGGFSDTLLGPLSGNNSYDLFGGSPLIATPLGLFMDFTQGNLIFDDLASHGGTTLQFFQASNGQLIIGWETFSGTQASINPTSASDLIGTAVPEPSTWALLLFGFAFFGLRQFWPGASHE